MKKFIVGLAFSMICFSGFAEEDTFNACGGENVINRVMDVTENRCAGDYTFIDICDTDGGNEYHVINYNDGPNSSCGGMPTVE